MPLLTVLLIVAGPMVAEGADANSVVNVENGAVTIDASVLTSSSQLQAWHLLADYETLPTYMPNVDTSRVTAHTDSSVLVRQVIKSWLILPWTFRVNLEFLEEPPGSLRFRQVGGRGGYQGRWSIGSLESGAQIRYEAIAEPDMLLPDFLLAYIVRRQIDRMMSSLAVELARRSGGN